MDWKTAYREAAGLRWRRLAEALGMVQAPWFDPEYGLPRPVGSPLVARGAWGRVVYPQVYLASEAGAWDGEEKVGEAVGIVWKKTFLFVPLRGGNLSLTDEPQFLTDAAERSPTTALSLLEGIGAMAEAIRAFAQAGPPSWETFAPFARVIEAPELPEEEAEEAIERIWVAEALRGL